MLVRPQVLLLLHLDTAHFLPDFVEPNHRSVIHLPGAAIDLSLENLGPLDNFVLENYLLGSTEKLLGRQT